MSSCAILQPSSGSRIPGMNGFLWVYAFSDSGNTAYLNCKCIRTGGYGGYHTHDLPWVGLPHDPILGWYVIFALKHEYVDGTSQHTLTARLIDSFGQQLDYKAVSDVGIDPPSAGPGKSDHGKPEKQIFKPEKEAAKDGKPAADVAPKHWLEAAEADNTIFPAALGTGYHHLVMSSPLKVMAPKKLKVTVAAKVRLAQTDPNAPPKFVPLAEGKEKPLAAGEDWKFELDDWQRLHGGTAVVRFTNPVETNPTRKHVLISVPLLDQLKQVKPKSKENPKGYEVEDETKSLLVYRPS